MRLRIITIGRLKRGAESSLCEDYLERLSGLGRQIGISSLDIKEIAESRNSNAALRRQEEANAALQHCTVSAFMLVLDERGDSVSSQNFMSVIQKELDGGRSDFHILIGGPDGHADLVRQRADKIISFGAMTWPHRLVRVMLLEQIYRSVTILLNHPYHRV